MGEALGKSASVGHVHAPEHVWSEDEKEEEEGCGVGKGEAEGEGEGGRGRGEKKEGEKDKEKEKFKESDWTVKKPERSDFRALKIVGRGAYGKVGRSPSLNPKP